MKARWLIACVLVIAIATAVAVLSRESAPRTGYVDTYHALEDGTAIVVWRDFGEDKRVSVVRLADDGRILWRRPIHAYAVGTTLAVGENTVVVRNFWDQCSFTPVPCDKLIALSIDTGRVLWMRDPTVRTGMAIRDGIPLARIIGGRYIDGLAVHRAEHDWAHSLFALDLHTGQLEWEVPLPRLLTPPLVVGDRLILHGNDGAVTAVEIASGNSVTAKLDDEGLVGIGCAVDDTYYNITRRHTDPRVTAFAGGDLGAPRRLGPIPRLPRRPWFTAAASCASTGNRLLFTMATYSNPAPDRTFVGLVIDRDGENGHVLEIAEGRPTTHDVRPLAGTMPRYTPVHWQTSDENRLILLDLENAKVVSRESITDASLLEMFHVANRWFLEWHSDRRGYVIAVLDGETGDLRAVNVDVSPSTRGLTRQHVAGGKLWLFDAGWGPRVPIDQMPVAVLDVTTLAPSFVRGIRVDDVTAAARKQLGLGTATP